MPHHRHSLSTFALASVVAAALVVAGCAADQPAPTPTKTPNGLVAAPNNGEPPDFTTPTEPSPTEERPTETPAEPTATEEPEPVEETPEPSDEPEPTPTWTPPPTQESLPGIHYWLQRPIPETYTDVVDRTYPYGSTSGGEYRVHHGYEFQNPRGTPVVAPAPGTVVHAGDDTITQFGPQTFYYGFLVVLELDSGLDGDPIFLLFGHMDKIDVEKGQRVETGDVLGTVGNSGVALGAHLHFEVRRGDMYDFDAVRNADLWIQPFDGFGTLAGHVQDTNGNPLYEISVTAADLDGTSRYTWTYADDTVQPDDVLGENVSLGDLPEGWYRVYVNHPETNKAIEEYIYVEPGKTAWVELTVE